MNVFTLKVLKKYDSNHVNNIYKKVENDIENFYCFTDDPKGLYEHIKPIIIDDVLMPVTFNKLYMFNPALNITDVIYLDLDVIIQKNISSLLRSKFTLIWSYWRNISEMHYETNKIFCRRTMLNSSVMSWKNPPEEIYYDFMQNKQMILNMWPGDDIYYYKHLFDYDIYEEGLICKDIDDSSAIIKIEGSTSGA